jgi:hypothetical protein
MVGIVFAADDDEVHDMNDELKNDADLLSFVGNALIADDAVDVNEANNFDIDEADDLVVAIDPNWKSSTA